jgi:hypothetical protein
MNTSEDGLGIKWESTLIYQQLYNAGANNTKFIPVIFGDGKLEHIPEPLQGSTFYNVEGNDGYEELYWRLRGVKKEKPELGKLREIPQKERKTLFISDLINQSDWDLAEWKNGVGYLHTPNQESPPIIVLFFETMEKGKNLFSKLITKIGREDKEERLRISIVEGAVPNQKNGYFVVIGENVDVLQDIINTKHNSKSINYIAINQRFHRIFIDDDSPHLNKFKEEYSKFKCFYLAPGMQINKENSSEGFEIDYDLMIFKRKIELRNYNEIPEENDPDSILKTGEYNF